MKKITILIGTIVAMLCLAEHSYGQESKFKIRITKEINGKRTILEKEYRNEEEMKADPDYQDLTGSEDAFNFYFSGDGDQEAYIELEKLGDEKGSSFFFFSDKEGAKNHIRILNGDEEGFDEEIERIHKEVNERLSEEEWRQTDNTFKVLRESEGDKYIYVVRSEKVRVVELEGNEFGKNGQVENSKKLILDDLRFSPNPSDGKFRLSFNVPKEDELTITIYNLEGKTAYHSFYEQFDGKYQEVIDLTNRDPGIYLLEIAIGKKRLTRKIVID